jgi:WD40 repeat protein
MLVSGGSDGSLLLWDTRDNNCTSSLSLDIPIYSIKHSGENSFMVSGG